MKQKFYIALSFITLLVVSGCSTIIKGSSQVVSIDSNVKGADVKVNGQLIGKTPFSGQIKRGSSTEVTLSKEGYDSKTIIMSTNVEPVFFGNVFCGGFIGSTTDAATGAMYNYAPATYNLDLTASGK